MPHIVLSIGTREFNVELGGFALIEMSMMLLFSRWGVTLCVCNIGNERRVTGLFTEAYMGVAPSIRLFRHGN